MIKRKETLVNHFYFYENISIECDQQIFIQSYIFVQYFIKSSSKKTTTTNKTGKHHAT